MIKCQNVSRIFNTKVQLDLSIVEQLNHIVCASIGRSETIIHNK